MLVGRSDGLLSATLLTNGFWHAKSFSSLHPSVTHLLDCTQNVEAIFISIHPQRVDPTESWTFAASFHETRIAVRAQAKQQLLPCCAARGAYVPSPCASQQHVLLANLVTSRCLVELFNFLSPLWLRMCQCVPEAQYSIQSMWLLLPCLQSKVGTSEFLGLNVSISFTPAISCLLNTLRLGVAVSQAQILVVTSHIQTPPVERKKLNQHTRLK